MFRFLENYWKINEIKMLLTCDRSIGIKKLYCSGTGEVLTTAEAEGRAHDQVPGLQ